MMDPYSNFTGLAPASPYKQASRRAELVRRLQNPDGGMGDTSAMLGGQRPDTTRMMSGPTADPTQAPGVTPAQTGLSFAATGAQAAGHPVTPFPAPHPGMGGGVVDPAFANDQPGQMTMYGDAARSGDQVLSPNAGHPGAAGTQTNLPAGAYPGSDVGPREIQKKFIKGSFHNFQRANPLMWQQIQELLNQSQHPDSNQRAADMAPQLERLDHAETGALGNARQDLIRRGLDASSLDAAMEGTIRSQAAMARSQTVRDAYSQEHDREQMARQQALALLQGMEGQGQESANAAMQRLQLQMQLQQMNQGGGIGDILGGLFSAGLGFMGGPTGSRLLFGAGGK